MDVAIPGLPSLGIGCPDGNLQGKPRFAWHRNSRPKSQRGTPQFTVSAADWLTLIEAFGLRAHLEDRGGGALTRR